jgi:hypothetical protein
MRQRAAIFFLFGAWLALLGLGGCVEPYVPAVVDAPTNYLVVDGYINGNGRTTILLSRTIKLATATTPPVEKGSSLFILDNLGNRYPLREQASGTYKSDSLLLAPGRQYQLRITTASNVTYESALVPLKVTPPINKLSWRLDGSQVQVQLSTHDPSGQARYYRWRSVETWEFNAAYMSFFEYFPALDAVGFRVTPIYTCWRTEQPSTIRQGSSAQLSQDALTDFALFSFPARAERLKIRYSVLVNQWAETPEEFAYYELLRKNTEAVGTVNDPLPTQLTGNVHRVDNSSEPVLGFVGAHTIQQQRLFIDRQELPFPNTWVFETPYQTCTFTDDARPELYNNLGNVPLDRSPMGFSGSSRECVDCRLRGTNVRPSFW